MPFRYLNSYTPIKKKKKRYTKLHQFSLLFKIQQVKLSSGKWTVDSKTLTAGFLNKIWYSATRHNYALLGNAALITIQGKEFKRGPSSTHTLMFCISGSDTKKYEICSSYLAKFFSQNFFFQKLSISVNIFLLQQSKPHQQLREPDLQTWRWNWRLLVTFLSVHMITVQFIM